MSHEETIALTITGLIAMITIAVSLVLAGIVNVKEDIVSTNKNIRYQPMEKDKKAKKKKVAERYSSEQTNNPDLTAEIINNAVINSVMDNSTPADCGSTMSDYGSGGDFGAYG